MFKLALADPTANKLVHLRHDLAQVISFHDPPGHCSLGKLRYTTDTTYFLRSELREFAPPPCQWARGAVVTDCEYYSESESEVTVSNSDLQSY